MKLSFDFQGQKIEYDLAYKKRTSIAIQVEADGIVNVIAPVGTPLFSVTDKVKGYAEWILEEKKRIQRLEETAGQFMYLGKTYSAEKIENAEKDIPVVKLVRGKFMVEGNELTEDKVNQSILDWYMKKTLSKIKERSKILTETFEKVPKKYDVKLIKNALWYIEDETIVFHVNCGVGPLSVLDTVFVEAMCQYNEYAKIQEKIDLLVPESETAKLWVKENNDRFKFR
ncbi:MAG: YgjP-like metallopeptidase domain-containing protein [Cellulosilyticaceae bacterium]